MKQFHCGDVVPGCTSSWESNDEQAILAAVAAHADEHGLAEMPDEVVELIRAHIQDVA